MNRNYKFVCMKVSKILMVIFFSSISLAYIPYRSEVHDSYKNDITSANQLLVGSGFFTPDNSELLSEKVTSIFIDSFNVKWFGTDKGISRFDGTNWDNINDNNFLLNNNVKQIAYERSGFGHEIWIATDGGLSVAAFDIDGISSATTYSIDNSGVYGTLNLL